MLFSAVSAFHKESPIPNPSWALCSTRLSSGCGGDWFPKEPEELPEGLALLELPGLLYWCFLIFSPSKRAFGEYVLFFAQIQGYPSEKLYESLGVPKIAWVVDGALEIYVFE